MIVPGMFVCIRFLISVCVESFAHIECYSNCLRRNRHFVEPFLLRSYLMVSVFVCPWSVCEVVLVPYVDAWLR